MLNTSIIASCVYQILVHFYKRLLLYRLMNWLDFLSELSWTHYTSLSLCEVLYAAYYARARLRDLAKTKAGLEQREGLTLACRVSVGVLQFIHVKLFISLKKYISKTFVPYTCFCLLPCLWRSTVVKVSLCGVCIRNRKMQA